MRLEGAKADWRRGVALMALVAAGCSARATGEAEYPSADCRRVALIDQATGARVRGAEDLAVDASRDRLIVSAYDRRAAEKAAGSGALSPPPEGGVYAVSFADLSGEQAVAAPLIAAGTVAGGLRPHGLVYIPQTDDIAFINRAYRREKGRWRLEVRIEQVSAHAGSPLEPQAAHCAANDLIADEAGLLVSFDHRACDWRAGLEDVFSLRRAGLASTHDGAVLFARASFANGVIASPDGVLALAATREKALLMLSGAAGDLHEERRIKLPGGPDNLTEGEGARIIAALHPSTWRLAAQRRLGLGAAPSRVVEIDPATGAVALLFDDPTGRIFAAATVAIERNGMLIVGSALDEGLLVCGVSGAHKS